MKIQVTFEKGVSRSFKQKCTQRVRKFVAQIQRQQKQWRKDEENSLKKYLDNDDDSYVQKYSQKQFNQPKYRKKIDHNKVNFKEEDRVLEQTKSSQRKLCKIQKLSSQKIDKVNVINKYDSDLWVSNLSVQQIKGNVDKIMSKIQEVARKQSSDNLLLKQQLVQTNRKVDKILINFQNNIVESEVQIPQFETQQQLLATTRNSNSFEDKFNELTNRYNYLRGSRTKQSKNISKMMMGKQSFSFEQTGDSLTFRHI